MFPQIKRSPGTARPDAPRWPRAMELLLCVGQVRASAANDERLQELLDQGLDWKKLLGSARLHGMLSLLQAKLGAGNFTMVPAEVSEALRRHSLALHAYNLRLVGELLALSDLFAANGVSVMPFKGPVLAMQAYGNLTSRPFADLDLLVHPGDVPLACDLLAQRGYTPRYQLSAGQRANLLRFGCEHPFQRVHPVDVALGAAAQGRERTPRKDDVDLHWNLFPPSFPIAFDADSLWRDTETVVLGRREIPTIGSDVLLLYLCAHGYAHHWNRLEWISAVAQLIAGRKEIHWDWVCREARRLGAERVLELGLLLAGDWLGAPVPADLLAGARHRPATATLIGHVSAQIQRDPGEEVLPASTSSEELFFDLDARENWRRRVSYFLRRLLTPSLEDVEWVSLPARWPALYYVLRPFRLSLRFLSSPPGRQDGSGNALSPRQPRDSFLCHSAGALADAFRSSAGRSPFSEGASPSENCRASAPLAVAGRSLDTASGALALQTGGSAPCSQSASRSIQSSGCRATVCGCRVLAWRGPLPDRGLPNRDTI